MLSALAVSLHRPDETVYVMRYEDWQWRTGGGSLLFAQSRFYEIVKTQKQSPNPRIQIWFSSW
jgi:hypothetical protein